MTIASTSYKTCFQYVGVSFAQLINENAGRLAANLLIVPLRLFLIVPAVSVPGLILCKGKSIDPRMWCCSCTDLSKKI